MDEQQFQDELKDILELVDTFSETEEQVINIENVSTFEESGIITDKKGLIVKLNDKTEFEIIIVQRLVT